MVSRDVLREADLHRASMNALATSQNDDVRQIARALLDSMKWLDANFTDVGNLFATVSRLESDVSQLKAELESANDKMRRLEKQIGIH